MVIANLSLAFGFMTLTLSVILFYFYFVKIRVANFSQAGLFFVCGSLYLIGRYHLGLDLSPAERIFWTRYQIVGVSGYFYTLPLFVAFITRVALNSMERIILGCVSFFFVILTAFTETLIKNQTVNVYNHTEVTKGIIYPVFVVMLAIISIYFFIRILLSAKRDQRIRSNYMPVIVGVGAGLLGGTMEIVSALLKKPFIKWPGDLGVFVVFIASISFLWASMPQYAKLLYSLSDYEEKVKKLMAKSNQSFVEFVQLIAKTLEAKDQYTAGHSQRVKEYSLLIADSMNLPKEDIELLEKACLLHDIGKLSIPEGVLNKKTPLTKKEWQYVLKHPVAGKELLNMVSDFQDIISIIYAHHERVDGKGYPNGQTNENIPLLARIIAVADVYDAMLSERPYRKAKTKPEAIEELNKVKGTQLDEVIVSKFVELITAQVL